jgi:hypothetical protein
LKIVIHFIRSIILDIKSPRRNILKNNRFVIIDSKLQGSIKMAAIFLSRKTQEKVTERQIETAIEYGLVIGGHKIQYVTSKKKPVKPEKTILTPRAPLLRYPAGDSPIERGIGGVVV